MTLGYLGLDPTLRSVMRFYDFIWRNNLDISGSKMTLYKSCKNASVSRIERELVDVQFEILI